MICEFTNSPASTRNSPLFLFHFFTFHFSPDESCWRCRATLWRRRRAEKARGKGPHAPRSRLLARHGLLLLQPGMQLGRPGLEILTETTLHVIQALKKATHTHGVARFFLFFFAAASLQSRFSSFSQAPPRLTTARLFARRATRRATRLATRGRPGCVIWSRKLAAPCGAVALRIVSHSEAKATESQQVASLASQAS